MYRRAGAIALAAAFIIACLSVDTAWAHPLLLQATPAPDSVLHAAPERVQLLFSEDVNGPASRLLVEDRAYRPVTQGSAFVGPDHRTLEVRLHHLRHGTYLVLWTVVSAEDGHVVHGAYLFSVGKRDPSVHLPNSATSSGQSFPDAGTGLALIAHWVALAGTVVWIGAAAFAVLVYPRTRGASPVPSEVRRRTLVIRSAIVAALLADVVELTINVWMAAPGAGLLRALSSILADQYGYLWIVRQVILLLALGSSFRLRTGRASSSPGLASRGLAGLGVFYLYAFAASGHAGSASVGMLFGSHLLSLAVLVDWLHLLGATVWLGGQVYVALVLIPTEGSDTTQMLKSLDRFSPAAWVSVGLLIVSGIFNAFIHIPSWPALLSSVYGRTLLVKVALIGAMILISAYTVFRLRPRIRRRLGAGHVPVRPLAFWLGVNPILGAAILLAVSVMFSYPVPAGFSSASATGPAWRASGLPNVFVHALARDRVGTLFAATHNGIYRRGANGIWRHILSRGEIWDIEVLPDNRTLLAADNAGYVDLSDDGGKRWRRTFITSQGVYAVSAVPGRPSWMLAGAGSGIYLSRDGGTRWQRRLRLANSAGAAVAWEPGGGMVFVGAIAGSAGGSTQVFASRDSGLTWHRFGRGLDIPGGIMSLTVSPTRRLFAGTMGHAVWRASLSGRTWRPVDGGMPTANDHVPSMVWIPGRPNTLFAATLGFGVFRSTDAGRHWQQLSRGLPASRNATIVLSLAYDPVHRVLDAGTANGVYALAHPFP